jgi:hypothetical protein
MRDNSYLIKSFLLLLLFLVVVILMLLIYIIPELKEYKLNRSVLKKYETLHKEELSIYSDISKLQDSLSKKYSKESSTYGRKFDENDFSLFLDRYLEDVSLVKIDSKSDILNYKVSGSLKNISGLYNLIDSLNSYSNFVKISFPIVYKVRENIISLELGVTILSS